MLKLKQGAENAIRIFIDAAAVNTDGMTMKVECNGVVKTFDGIANGRRYTFWMTAAESASLPVGKTVGMTVSILGSGGDTINSSWMEVAVVPAEWTIQPSDRKIYYQVVVPNAHALDGLQYLSFSSSSAFPTAGQSGFFYYASDTAGLYVWNGTNYVEVGGGGGGGASPYYPYETVTLGTTPVDIGGENYYPATLAPFKNWQYEDDGKNIKITIGSLPATVTGVMRDLWFTVYCPYDTVPSLDWPAVCEPRDGDATSMQVAANAYTTFMIAEKYPDYFVVARVVTDEGSEGS